MRYFATLPGHKEPQPIELTPLGEGRYAVTVEGVRCEVDAVHTEPGALSLLIDGESYSVDVDDAASGVSVRVRDQVFSVDVADERRMRMRASAGDAAAEGKQVVRAPMPGKVVKLLVKVGDPVTAGQGLVVVEAMKMENELKSPKAGTVREVSVAEGQTVEAKAALVVVE